MPKSPRSSKKARLPVLPLLFAALSVVVVAVIAFTYFIGNGRVLLDSDASVPATEYITVVGKDLKYRGNTIQLRGVHMNNAIAQCSRVGEGRSFGSCRVRDINIRDLDYQRLSAMNANVVRIGMSYGWYRDNRQEFFTVMQDQFDMARRNRIWVIPTLIALPGDCYEGWNQTCPMWTNDTLKTQFKTFWADFAGEFYDEQVIAAYGLINEPTVPGIFSGGNSEVWYQLAEQTIPMIRQRDPLHPIIVATDWNSRFPRKFGNNIIYEVHDYLPTGLTHSDGTYTMYPGPAPVGAGQIQPYFWNKDRFQTGGANSTAPDYSHSMSSSLGLDWANDPANNVPIFVGEFGARRNYPTYKYLIKDKGELYNDVHGLSWILHEWRSDDSGFEMYANTLSNGALVPRDNELISIMTNLWARNPRPTFPPPSPRPTPTPSPSPIPTPSPPTVGNVVGFPKPMQLLPGGDGRIRLTEVKEPSGGKAYIKAEITGFTPRKVLWYLNGQWSHQDTTAPFFFGGDVNGVPNGFSWRSTQVNTIRAAIFYGDGPNDYVEASTRYLGCLGSALGDLQNGELRVGNCDQDLFGSQCSSAQRPRVFCNAGVVSGACRDPLTATPSMPSCATPLTGTGSTGPCTSPIGQIPRGTSVTASVCGGYGCGTYQRLRAFCDASGRLFLACRDHTSSPPAPRCF